MVFLYMYFVVDDSHHRHPSGPFLVPIHLLSPTSPFLSSVFVSFSGDLMCFILVAYWSFFFSLTGVCGRVCMYDHGELAGGYTTEENVSSSSSTFN